LQIGGSCYLLAEFSAQWRHQDIVPEGGGRTACVFTKSGRNHRNIYVNIYVYSIIWKMCGVLVLTTSSPLPIGDICKKEIAKLVYMRKIQGAHATGPHSW